MFWQEGRSGEGPPDRRGFADTLPAVVSSADRPAERRIRTNRKPNLAPPANERSAAVRRPPSSLRRAGLRLTLRQTSTINPLAGAHPLVRGLCASAMRHSTPFIGMHDCPRNVSDPASHARHNLSMPTIHIRERCADAFISFLFIASALVPRRSHKAGSWYDKVEARNRTPWLCRRPPASLRTVLPAIALSHQ